MGGKKDAEPRAPGALARDQVEDLFRRYYRRVRGYFLNRGCTDEEARELTQTTFLRAAGEHAVLRDHSAEQAWMFVIASNVWRSHLRRFKAEKRDAAEVPLQGFEDGGEGLLARSGPRPPTSQPLDDVLRKERRERLADALERLPPQRRTCLQLYALRGFKYREIADMLGVSVGTVKSQIFDARETLRQELGEVFGDPPVGSGGGG